MKTTIDLPDPLFRKGKATASAEGVSLKSFITEAVELKLNSGSRSLAAVLNGLPKVSAKVLEKVRIRIEKSDATDLSLQKGTDS